MKAVIYARYSDDNQTENSIEGQLRECKEYAEKQGITVFGTYIDRALSAKTDKRPEEQRCQGFSTTLRKKYRIPRNYTKVSGSFCGKKLNVKYFSHIEKQMLLMAYS